MTAHPGSHCLHHWGRRCWHWRLPIALGLSAASKAVAEAFPKQLGLAALPEGLSYNGIYPKQRPSLFSCQMRRTIALLSLAPYVPSNDKADTRLLG
jgi:hypothetical protein